MPRIWVLGNTTEGYSVHKTSHKIEPWESQVWDDGRVVCTNLHDTKEDAISYCHYRAEKYNRGLKKR